MTISAVRRSDVSNASARTSLTPLDAVNWTTVAIDPVMNIWFAPATTISADDEPSDTVAWNAAGTAAVLASLQSASNVANLTFNVVADPGSADFGFLLAQTLPAETEDEEQLGFFMNQPQTLEIAGASYVFDGFGVFNSTASSWTSDGLQVGGAAFTTVLHEIGHGLGLSHPHDNSSEEENDPNPPATIMLGVEEPYGDYGNFDLNQGVFTVMSYNDGWHTSPAGLLEGESAFGASGTFSAIDIAVLQQKYGANASFASGDDVYALPAADGAGSYYSAIWDTGGIDTISASGAGAGAVIDLTAATLDYSATGGGVVSHVSGVHGGVTIAGGVVIENAVGGAGNDEIRGNDARNVLAGGRGDDRISGGGDLDVVRIASGRAGADVGVSGERVATIASADGTDTLDDVERVLFDDGGLAFDTGVGEIAGTVFRTYQAAYDRAPDAPGLGFWIGAADRGLSFEAVAQGFVASPEFAAIYGADPSASDFVGRLYENVLGRAGEAGGVAFWENALDEGVGRAAALRFFTDAPENLELTASAVANGIAYDPVGMEII